MSHLNSENHVRENSVKQQMPEQLQCPTSKPHIYHRDMSKDWGKLTQMPVGFLEAALRIFTSSTHSSETSLGSMDFSFLSLLSFSKRNSVYNLDLVGPITHLEILTPSLKEANSTSFMSGVSCGPPLRAVSGIQEDPKKCGIFESTGREAADTQTPFLY